MPGTGLQCVNNILVLERGLQMIRFEEYSIEKMLIIDVWVTSNELDYELLKNGLEKGQGKPGNLLKSRNNSIIIIQNMHALQL